jgi:hypothetical protein
MTAPRSFAALLSTPEYRLTRASLVRKYIARKPLILERTALNTAALLAVRAQFASVDPNVSPDELVKIIAASRRALDNLAEITRGKRCVRVRRGEGGTVLPTFSA